MDCFAALAGTATPIDLDISRATTGAYGKPPSDEKRPPYDPNGPAPQQFANPVHCVKLANDGLLYVQERRNLR